MCGRYNIQTDPRAWIDAFTLLIDHRQAVQWQPRYNVAPSQRVPVIRSVGDCRELIEMRWGYVPTFVKEDRPRVQPINARADKLESSGYYHRSFQRRRCLLPAKGFYEWRRLGGSKIPCNIQLPGRQQFLLGGIWDTWRGIDTVAIITTDASAAIRKIHSRMPLIVPPEQAAEWLDGDSPAALFGPSVLQLESYPVSTRVNNPENDGPVLIDELPDKHE